MKRPGSGRIASLAFAGVAAVMGGGAGALLGACGPFDDVTADAFCPFVLEIFYLGITTGTTPTTYDPAANVSRLQMAAFLSRTVDGVLKRGSRRAALGQFWNTGSLNSLALMTVTAISGYPASVQSDGTDLWVSGGYYSTVSRVRASDGRLLETWTAEPGSMSEVLVAMGRVFVAGGFNPGKLFVLDPSQPAGAMTVAATNLGSQALSIAFDGARIWTTNYPFGSGSVSIITPGPTLPWTVTTVTAGFVTPYGLVFDGSNVWVTDQSAGTLSKLDANGGILQTVTIGPAAQPGRPVFDGENIWVPNQAAFTTSIIRASTGALLQNLPGNGQNFPEAAAFDGERVLISGFGRSLSLWRASDLTPLGFLSFPSGTIPTDVCTDGDNFWVTLSSITSAPGQLARF